MTYQAGRATASQPFRSPSASQPSGSVSSQASVNPTLGASKPPKKKLLVRVDGDGQVVGENSAKFITKAGKYIRSTIPIILDKWPLIPSDFKDKLWRRLTEKIKFNVPEKLARPKLEKHFPSIWSGAKSRYRTKIIRKAESLKDALQKCPDGVDPNHWNEFIFKQEDPKVQEVCARNARNRSCYKGGHSLGRRSYAQRLDILKNEEPEKKHSRVSVWMAGCERADGTILDNVRDKYDKVKEAHSKQSENSSNDDIDNFVDINEDALTQVFGRDKRNRTRGVSSHISNKQFQQAVIAKVLLEQTSSSNAELKTDVAEIKANMNTLLSMVKQGGCNGAGNSQPPSAAYTLGTDLGPSSVNLRSHPTPQNIVKPPSAACTPRTNSRHGSVNRHPHSTPQNLVKHLPAANTHGNDFRSGSVNNHPHLTPQNLVKPACATYETDFGAGSVSHRPRPSPGNLVKPPSAACTHGTDFMPSSVNPMSRPTPQNLVNLVQSRECNKNSSIKRKVTLLGKNMDAIAEGYVVTDMTAGICHFRKVMQGEKKVEVTKVLDTSAPIYDEPQADYSTMQDIVDGGFLIWLKAVSLS